MKAVKLRTDLDNSLGHYAVNPQEVYTLAIEAGSLSVNQDADNYAGLFMYMHSEACGCVHWFKNRNTRKYLEVRL